MFCKNCGASLEDTAEVCANCGTAVENNEQVSTATAPQQNVVYAAPATPVVTNVVPEENRPLSPWAYFGLQILFSIPIVGFVFLIVFSCSGANINRRNFARSYWCGLLIVAILAFIVVLVALLGGFYYRASAF